MAESGEPETESQTPEQKEQKGAKGAKGDRRIYASRVSLAATILTPGFSDRAGDIGLRVAKPARLLEPAAATNTPVSQNVRTM